MRVYLWALFYGLLLVCFLSLGVLIPYLRGLTFIILPLILTILLVQFKRQWEDSVKITVAGLMIGAILSLIPFMLISNSITPREEFIVGTQITEIALAWMQFFVTLVPLTIVGIILGILARKLREILL